MPSDNVEDLLKSDFDALTQALDRDRFAERLLFRLSARRRARLGCVALACGLGAAFAASQFSSVVAALSGAFAAGTPQMAAAGFSPQLLAALMLSGALVATAFVLRQDF